MSTPARRAARWWWAVLAGVVGVAVAGDLLLDLFGADAEPVSRWTRVVRFISYFTIESNLWVVGSTLLLVRDPDHDGRWWRFARMSALLGITITGIVYFVVLRPTDHPVGLRVWTNAGQHYVSPVMTMVGWLVFGPRPRTTTRLAVGVLAWPLLWVGYTLIHGAVVHWYPYDFLNVDQLGYPTALTNVGGVVLVALALLLVFRFVDARLPAVPRRVPPVLKQPAADPA